MKKMYFMLIMAMVTPLLGGCFGKGSSADPPANFSATAGDGRVILAWDSAPGVDYWIFTATDPSVTAFNWANLPNAHGYINATTPFYICGLFNGSQYYFAANGRTNGGPGGTSSLTITATNPPYYPYNASAVTWTPGSTTPTASSDFLGVGYTSLTTCSNNSTSAAGSFAAVGLGAEIYTSPDGMKWTNQTTPSGFTANLNAVTGYAASLNNPTTPNLRWVAVGDGGASVYSTDGVIWTVGNSFNSSSLANPNNHALHSLTQVAGTFFAVGDTGTILSTTDGITWTAHTSGISNNLNGVTHGNIYVAVGNSGTILTSGNGSNWGVPTSVPAGIASINLQKVASYGNIIVAVGDSGTIVTSIDNGANWTSQTQGAPALVGVAAESQIVANAPVDTKLGYVSTAQFVAVNSAGETYTSQNGIDWSPGNSTGINPTQALVSSGFGYASVGSGGATAYAF